MKCPVCKTECGDIAICSQCGFDEVGKIFINQEEADEWLEKVVVPFKESYDKSNVLPPIDWIEVFKQNPRAKRLFEFSIPVAIKRRGNLDKLKDLSAQDYETYLSDAILGHYAIVSEDDTVRNHLFDAIETAYLSTTKFKRTASLALESKGDVAAILGSLEPGDVLIVEMNGKMRKDAQTVFSKALKDFCLEVIIGKGPGSRRIILDLPPFTTIFVATSTRDIPEDIVTVLEDLIDFNLSQEEIDELQIRENASVYDVQLVDATLEVIKEYKSCKTFNNVRSILRYVSDYLFLHPEMQQPLSETAMRNLLKNFDE